MFTLSHLIPYTDYGGFGQSQMRQTIAWPLTTASMDWIKRSNNWTHLSNVKTVSPSFQTASRLVLSLPRLTSPKSTSPVKTSRNRSRIGAPPGQPVGHGSVVHHRKKGRKGAMASMVELQTAREKLGKPMYNDPMIIGDMIGM